MPEVQRSRQLVRRAGLDRVRPVAGTGYFPESTSFCEKLKQKMMMMMTLTKMLDDADRVLSCDREA